MARTSPRGPRGFRLGREFVAVAAIVAAILASLIGANALASARADAAQEDATESLLALAAEVTADRLANDLAALDDAAREAESIAGGALIDLGAFGIPEDAFADDPFLDEPFLDDPLLDDPLVTGAPLGEPPAGAAAAGVPWAGWFSIDQFLGVLTDQPQISSMYIAFTDGGGYGVEQLDDGGWASYRADPYAEAVYMQDRHDPQGFVVSSGAWAGGADWRTSSWYTTGAAALESQWIQGQEATFGGGPVVSVVRPLFGFAGELIGVVRVELDQRELAGAIGDITLGDGGDAFLLSGARDVLAGSDDYVDQIAAGAGDGKVGPAADALGISSPPAGAPALFEADGYTALEIPIGDPELPSWTVHVRASADELTPGVDAYRDTMTIYSIVLAVVAVLAGVVLALLRGPIARLRERATKDSLTGVLNRQEFQERATQMLAAAERRGGVVAIVMIDLDDFKGINDTWGHHAGDEALQQAAGALEDAAGPRDVVGRFGGDEFVVARWLDAGEDAGGAVERMRGAVVAAIRAGRLSEASVGASAGFALSGGGINDLGALLSAADDALISGKSRVKGTSYEG